MNGLAQGLLAWAAALALLLAASAEGSDVRGATAADYAGSWELAVAAGQAEGIIERAIVKGTEDMPPLRRRIARKRLADKNRVVHRIQIAFPGDHIAITLEGDHYRAPATGRLVRVRLSDGEVARVAHRLHRGRLVQRFVGDDGVRTDVFMLAAEGDILRMHVVLTSDRLPAPIRYTIPYRRP